MIINKINEDAITKVEMTNLDQRGVRLAPKWYTSGTFPDQISVHFQIWFLKTSRICTIWGQSDPFWRQMWHPYPTKNLVYFSISLHFLPLFNMPKTYIIFLYISIYLYKYLSIFPYISIYYYYISIYITNISIYIYILGKKRKCDNLRMQKYHKRHIVI